MNLERFLAAEHWKKTALLGWLLTIEVGVRHAITGDDPGTGMVSLIGVLILGAAAWQGVKRGTQFRPTETARAEQIRNGNDREVESVAG